MTCCRPTDDAEQTLLEATQDRAAYDRNTESDVDEGIPVQISLSAGHSDLESMSYAVSDSEMQDVPVSASGDFKTIIAFLHCGGRNSQIRPLCHRFLEVCEKDSIGRQYNYLILPGLEVSSGAGGLAGAIEAKVQEACAEGRQGLVLLTGCRGGVGLDVSAVSLLQL